MSKTPKFQKVNITKLFSLSIDFIASDPVIDNIEDTFLKHDEKLISVNQQSEFDLWRDQTVTYINESFLKISSNAAKFDRKHFAEGYVIEQITFLKLAQEDIKSVVKSKYENTVWDYAHLITEDSIDDLLIKLPNLKDELEDVLFDCLDFLHLTCKKFLVLLKSLLKRVECIPSEDYKANNFAFKPLIYITNKVKLTSKGVNQKITAINRDQTSLFFHYLETHG